MKIREIMTADVKSVSPQTTIVEASDMMKTFGIGCLPVCENGKVLGVVTDRDIVVRSAARGDNPMVEKVRDIMSSDVVFALEDHDLEDIARLMEVKKVRRILILNRQRDLSGIVSIGDISRLGGHRELSAEVLVSVSEPIEEFVR